MELSPVDNIDVGRITLQEKTQTKDRDVKTVAQILEPILGDNARVEAKKLLAKFSTINALFQYFAKNEAPIIGMHQPVIQHLKAVAKSFVYALEREILNGPVLPDSSTLHDYLFNSFAIVENEVFRVLFLDAANRLIEDRIMGIGTVNRIQIYAREIVKAALSLNATAVILAHNHPSGDPKPSRSDIVLTKKVMAACETFELNMIDHLIVARSGVTSLRELGLLHTNADPDQSTGNRTEKSSNLFETGIQAALQIVRKL